MSQCHHLILIYIFNHFHSQNTTYKIAVGFFKVTYDIMILSWNNLSSHHNLSFMYTLQQDPPYVLKGPWRAIDWHHQIQHTWTLWVIKAGRCDHLVSLFNNPPVHIHLILALFILIISELHWCVWWVVYLFLCCSKFPFICINLLSGVFLVTCLVTDTASLSTIQLFRRKPCAM